MAQIRYADEERFDAPPDRVFDYRLDFTNLPAYNPNVTDMRRIDGGALGAGAEYTFMLSLPGAPEPMETPIRVVEASRPSRIVFDTGPGFIAREICTFEPAGEGTRATFEIVLTLPGEVDDAARAAVEASGREQVRLELDLMRKALDG